MRKVKPFPKKVLWSLLITGLVLLGLHLILGYISIVIYDQQHGAFFELANRFDVNDENSVPQWFSQLIFLLIGASALLAAYLQTKKPNRRFWFIIGIIGILLSLDDVATLHEFILQLIHITYFTDQASTFFINAWWLLLPFVLAIAGALAWYGWRLLPRRTLILLIAGGAVYIGGKILMDSTANNVTDLFIERGIVQGMEKFFQYSGSTIVLYAVLDYLQNNYEKNIKKAIAQLKK